MVDISSPTQSTIARVRKASPRSGCSTWSTQSRIVTRMSQPLRRTSGAFLRFHKTLASTTDFNRDLFTEIRCVSAATASSFSLRRVLVSRTFGSTLRRTVNSARAGAGRSVETSIINRQTGRSLRSNCPKVPEQKRENTDCIICIPLPSAESHGRSSHPSASDGRVG